MADPVHNPSHDHALADQSTVCTPVKSAPAGRSLASAAGWLGELGWADRFELMEIIGTGGMGQVWRARELSTQKFVALKVLKPSCSGNDLLLARLDIEAATLMKLRDAGQHEYIVPVFDFKLTDSLACLVMEFIPGLNLYKWCDAQHLDLKQRVKLIAQTAGGCGWFHTLGVVHRDLKPTNILVSAITHQPVIVDFSIAKHEDNLPLTLTNEALGTASYMAPEQIDPMLGPISPATDVYALGATLYELITHVLPHPGGLPQIIHRHQNEVRPARPSLLNDGVPGDLESICLKALSHRPSDRYPGGAALADDLDRFLAGRPVTARPISHLTHLARQARRKPALTATLAACLVIGGFALWNVQRQAVQKAQFALESKLTTAMQQSTWAMSDLEQAEAALAALGGHDTALATELRQRLHDDVVHDMEARLQQNHLRDEDYDWLRTTGTWLETRSPLHAGRLQSLITDRAGRWETQAELHAPFTDMQGLFAYSHVRAEGPLLYPKYDPGEEPLITITKSVSVPMEAACTFVAEAASFESITLVFYNQGSRLAVGLHKVRHLGGSTVRLMGVPSPDPESYALTLAHHQNLSRIVHLPDVHLLDQPFRLTLRVEREWAEADLNGRTSLRVDSPFAMASGQVTNYWRITWPKDIGLKALTLRTRRADAVSPLEDADLAAMQGQYDEALRRYGQLRGDPYFGTEASYKIAVCLMLQGDPTAAQTIWESVTQGPPSRWRDRSLFRLWLQSAIFKQGDASRYLALLPEPLPAELFRQISQEQINDLIVAYAPVGMGIALPRVDPAVVTEADKAFRLLHLPPVQSASRFALAHHMARLDQEADTLYHKGLEDALKTATKADDLMAATNCLDQWCRLTPSDKTPRLAVSLDQWQKKKRTDPTVQTIWLMEQTRAAARAANLPIALKDTQETRPHEKADNRVRTSAWLLEGMVHRMNGAEGQAQSAWRRAQEIAATVTVKSPLHLMDRVLLHSLTRSWDLHSLGEVLPSLLTKHLRSQERTAAQAAILQTFLTDPAWLSTFNAVLQDEPGRKFAEDYVLCRQPPRELVLEFYRLLFEHFFLTTTFPQATPEQSSRVRSIVDALVTEMAMNPRAEMAHLQAYLRTWTDPASARDLFDQAYPYTPALIENLKWLMQQRHHVR